MEHHRVSVPWLLRKLEEMPAHPNVAMRVVLETNDEQTSAARLGRLIEIDPSLTTHVMRLANSAHYGLPKPAASAARAVSVLGLDTVRSVATTVAAGVMDDGSIPEDFWEHGVTTAVACAELAHRTKIERAAGFSMGLLHDLGTALLRRCDPGAYDEAMARADAGEVSMIAAEIEAFGLGHDEAAGRVLEAWGFPEEIHCAIRRHHDSAATQTEHLRALHAAEELAAGILGTTGHETLRLGTLGELGIGDAEQARLLEGVQVGVDAVLAVFAPLTVDLTSSDASARPFPGRVVAASH